MKVGKLFSLLLMAALVAFVQAGAREDIWALYGKLEMAIKKMDIKMIRWTATPDMKWKDVSGKVIDLDQLAMQIEQKFAMTKKVTSCDFKASNLKVMGNKAMAMSSFKITADVMGEKGDMKTHKLVNWGKSKDYFRKTKDGWRCYMVEEVENKTTIDGKPMKMGS